MKPIILSLLLSCCTVLVAPPCATEVVVSVRTNDILVGRPTSLVGGNIEDFNEQLYGGLTGFRREVQRE